MLIAQNLPPVLDANTHKTSVLHPAAFSHQCDNYDPGQVTFTIIDDSMLCSPVYATD